MGDSLDPFQLTQKILLLFPEISMAFLLAKVLFFELLSKPVYFIVVELDDVLLLVLEHLASLELHSAYLF